MAQCHSISSPRPGGGAYFDTTGVQPAISYAVTQRLAGCIWGGSTCLDSVVGGGHRVQRLLEQLALLGDARGGEGQGRGAAHDQQERVEVVELPPEGVSLVRHSAQKGHVHFVLTA